MKRAGAKLKYIITPEALPCRQSCWLITFSLPWSFTAWCERSVKAKNHQEKGVDTIQIEGDGEVAEILKLTCHEQGIHMSEDHPQTTLKWLD